MEEEAHRQRQEEKNSDHPTLPGQKAEAEIQSWQIGGSTKDEQNLPIMHWEALSLRIAELEKQEEERRERSKCMGLPAQDRELGGWTEMKHQSFHRNQWADEEDFGGCRIPVFTSRFNSPKNLQLCFINNSESEDEDEKGASSKEFCRGQRSDEAEGRGSNSSGLKQEVRAALSALRDKLWAEEREKERLTCSNTVIQRKQPDRGDLQTLSMQQLASLRASLNQDIHDLSSELVRHLLIRDHLRTKQDAMLLDVQDMTSV